MRIAIIDLGTNSVRFDVHQIASPNSVKRLYREKIMLRLGHDVFSKGRLEPPTIRRTLAAFLRFKRITIDLHVKKIIALSTSALREAQDGRALIESIQKHAGVEIRILSGREEARLIALGIMAHERLPKHPIGLIDMGGGSTEITLCQNGKILKSESFPLGTARLQQIFLKQNPPPHNAIVKLKQHVQKVLAPSLEHWPRVSQFFGGSGTTRALVKLSGKSKEKKRLSGNELKKLIRQMQSMTLAELLEMPGMEIERADMILSGALLLRECMKSLGVRTVIPTEYTLRDGVLQEVLAFSKRRSFPLAFRLPDLYEKAMRLGETPAHIQAVVQLATYLFRALQPIHKLDKTFKIYLVAAAILRNAGEMISFMNHPEHSYYLVKQAGFPFVEEWETELVAFLCRHHERLKGLPVSTLPFRKDRSKRQVFLKLLTMMCLIDALDVDLTLPLKLKKIRSDKKIVRLFLSRSSSLELLRVAERSGLFEKVFKRRLVALGV